MNRPVPARRRPIYRFVATILIINALISLYFLGSLGRNIRLRTHSRDALDAIGRVSSSINDVEIEMRNYLLAGKVRDREAFARAVSDVDRGLAELEERTRDAPVQQARVSGLRHVVAERVEAAREAVNFRKSRGLELILPALNSERAARTTREIRRLLAEMKGAEDQSFRTGTTLARRAIGRTLPAFLLVTGLALLLLRLVYSFSRRETAERGRAEAAIREREEWLSATLASISDAVIATDNQGRVRLINPVAQALTGWGLDESRGRMLDEVFSIVHEESRLPLKNAVARVLHEGVTVGVSNHAVLIDKGGAERPIEHCGAPIRDGAGTITGVVLIVEFEDTGVGLDPDLLPRIFDPFEQGDPVVRRRLGGLGLGQAISRGIVEAHGGRLTASSPGRGRGATFRVELGVVPAPSPQLTVSSMPPAPRPRQGVRILLVEDNRDTLHYMALVLRQRHHEVQGAGSLRAARALLVDADFDLLISDIELPDGTGLELMREMPVGTAGIAISGFGSEEDLRQSQAAGFAAHLTKPIDVRELDQTIRRVTVRDTRPA